MSEAGVGHFTVTAEDRDSFRRLVRDAMPEEVFDAHVHLCDQALLSSLPDDHWSSEGPSRYGREQYDWELYREQVADWMGDRVPRGGLVTSQIPGKPSDLDGANKFIAGEVSRNKSLRGLLFVRPDDNPDDAKKWLENPGFVGFKVYLSLVKHGDPYQADVQEFLPEWVWELADERELVILLHLAKDRAVADPANQAYIREHCLRYRDARLILAHCARSFSVVNAMEGIPKLRGLDNVFFDTAAICEPYPIEQIIRAFGPTRLMFGTDYPICQMRGRSVSIRDGFLWIDHQNVDWTSSSRFGTHTVFGIESVLALVQACRAFGATSRDIEQIYCRTAEELFGLREPTTGTGQALYLEAKKIIPGGSQLFGKRSELFAPGQWPAYFREARGCTLVDMDNKHYVDMSSMGILACMFGYADPDVTAAVQRRVQFGSMTTLIPPEEVEVARLLLEFHPWAQSVRFARTGGETMTVAVRIARATTGREKVAICGYHGWHDWYLAANLGTGGVNRLEDHLLPGLLPNGVPRSLAGTTLPFHFNRLDELEQVFSQTQGELAAVVLETSRTQLPQPGFFEGVRRLCDRHGTMLIVDEISIGWRLARGGAHLKFGLEPDMAVFAKTISNGHPMGAVIGRRKAMEGALESFISSAYWTEAVGPAAALATLTKMKEIDVVSYLDRIGVLFKQSWNRVAAKHGVKIETWGHNCMPGFKFVHPKSLALDTLYTVRMLAAGYLATSSVCVTMVHEPRHVQAYEQAMDPVFAEIAEAIERDDIERRIGGPVRSSGFARLT